MASTTQHFDTLRTAEALREAGLEEHAAKAISLAIDQGRENGDLVTQPMLKAMLKAELASLEIRLIKWIVAIVLGATAITIAAVRLIVGS